jgi:hypothetical protein
MLYLSLAEVEADVAGIESGSVIELHVKKDIFQELRDLVCMYIRMCLQI